MAPLRQLTTCWTCNCLLSEQPKRLTGNLELDGTVVTFLLADMKHVFTSIDSRVVEFVDYFDIT